MFFRKFSVTPSGKTMCWTRKCFGDAKMVQTSIPMLSVAGLALYTLLGAKKSCVCFLFLTLFE